MCDYSLMGVPNRLANEGEDLILHRFVTGSLGLISDVPAKSESVGFWSTIKRLFGTAASADETAVCVAPGTRLRVRDIPEQLQRSLRVSSTEEVIFTQLTAQSHTYRDAVRFNNGAEILLQHLHQGQRVRVLQLSSESEVVSPMESAFREYR